MTTSDFSATILVDRTPAEVFNAINNVRGWWSQEIQGDTTKLNDVFLYRYQDVHRCKIKLVEVVPSEKVVWHVMENHFSFTKDESEWTNTKIVFEISKGKNKTRLRFTHVGLVPEYECYDVCHEGWSNYINTSLRDLIITGKGQPNPKEGGFNEQIVEKWNLNNKQLIMDKSNYTTSIVVEQAPHNVFEAICDVQGWWTENVTGKSKKVNDVFEVRFSDVHYSQQQLVEVIPDRKIVWLVTASELSFLSDKSEWTDTRIVFDIVEHGEKTMLRFTHQGLVPQIECYAACSNAWRDYVTGSLRELIVDGKGHPDPKNVKLKKVLNNQ